MSGERGEKSGRWVVVIVFLIWAVSLAGFSFDPSGSHGDEFSLDLPEARGNPGFPSDGVFPKYDSLNVERAGYWPYGPARSVLAEGGYVYVGYGGGIWIFDVSEPDSPVVAGMVATPDLVEDMVYHDGVLYVANSYAGVTAIDVSDPEHPEVVGNRDMHMRIGERSLALWYPYLFVVGESRKILVLDVSDPGSMDSVATYAYEPGVLPGPIDVGAGGYLFVYVSGMPGGIHVHSLEVWDIRDPMDRILRGRVILEWMGCSDMEVRGGYAYISRYRGLWVVDVHDPDSIYVASVDSTWVNLTGLDVEGGYAYVKSGDNLVVYDIREPYSPCVVGFGEVGGGDKLSAMGGYVYVVNMFKVVDCRDPSAPELVYEKLDGPGAGRDVDVSGDYCYYACSEGGVYILRRRPEGMQMEVVGHIGGLLGVREADRVRVDSVRNRVYVAGSDSLRVYDVSDVSHPVMLGECYVGHWWNVQVDMEYSGDEVLVVVGGKLRVVDVSDPGDPSVVGEFEGHGGIVGVEVRDDSLVYLWGNKYLYVVDVSDGYNPEEVVEYDFSEWYYDFLEIANLWVYRQLGSGREYLFLDIGIDGYAYFLVIHDMTDIYNMEYVEVFSGGAVGDIVYSGERMYALGLFNDVSVCDLSGDPGDWGLVGWYHGVGGVKIDYSGGLIYAANHRQGLQVFHYSGDTVGVREGSEGSRRNLKLKIPSLLGGEGAPVELSVPRDGVVKLDLYDVSGRRVRELWRGYVSKGDRRIEVDFGGLCSGVYFLRAEAGREVEVKRFILVR